MIRVSRLRVIDHPQVVYARPDLRFASPVDVGVLARLGADELYTPRWGCWMGGVNDRFAAARPAVSSPRGEDPRPRPIRGDAAVKMRRSRWRRRPRGGGAAGMGSLAVAAAAA